MATTIQVPDRLKRRLAKRKRHPRETYADVIARALDLEDEDRLELSPEFKAKLRRGRRQHAEGKYLTTEQLLKELGL